MGKIGPGVFNQIFADAVEDDDRIMDRKADDRQNGGDKKRVNFDVEIVAKKGEQAEDDEGIVEQGNDGRDAKFPGSVGLGDTSERPSYIENYE